MKIFPLDFLEMMANEYNLHNMERKIFIELFSVDLPIKNIAKKLGIRPENVSNRMTPVYKIFGLNGLEKNKRERLSVRLEAMYKQYCQPPQESKIIVDKDGSYSPVNYLVRYFEDRRKFPELLKYLTNPDWGIVFRLLVKNHLPEQQAKEFLEKTKAEIDKILSKDERLQQFLEWVKNKSQALAESIKKRGNQPHLAAIRACYFDFDIAIDIDRSFAYRLEPDFTRDFTCASFIARAEKSTVIKTFPILSEIKGLQESHQLDPAMAIVFERANALQALLKKTDSNTRLGRHLRELEKELPNLSDPTQDETVLKTWYDEKGHDWGIKLRLIIVGYFSLGEKWRYQIETNENLIEESHNEEITIFTDDQYELLEKYYYANKLFLECLEGDNISEKVREEFKNTLFLPITRQNERSLDLQPIFDIPKNLQETTTISKKVAYLLENPNNQSLINEVNQELPKTLDLAFKCQHDQELFEIHKTLFQIYETSLSHPLSAICKQEHSSWLIKIRNEIEEKWLDYEIKYLTSVPHESVTGDSHKLREWFMEQAKQTSEIDTKVLNFLKEEATKEQFNIFILSDAILNYRFCDALALAQIHFSDNVKAEIVSNMYDECGHGNAEKFHSKELSKMLKSLNLEQPRPTVWGEDWRPYAGHNLYFLFALNRQHYFKSLGSIAMPEIFDPHRDEVIVDGLKRLYSDANYDFYRDHIVTDQKHGQQWLNCVIAPIVDIDSKLGRELAIGGAMRMVTMRRYNEYFASSFGL